MSTETASIVNIYESICKELVDDIDFYSLIKENRKFYSPSKIYGAYNTIRNGVYSDTCDSDDDDDADCEYIHKYAGHVSDLINNDNKTVYFNIIKLEMVDDIDDIHLDGVYLTQDVVIDGKTYLSDCEGNVFTDDLSAWGFKKGEGIMKISEYLHCNVSKNNTNKYEYTPGKHDNYWGYIATMDAYKKYCKSQEYKNMIDVDYRL